MRGQYDKENRCNLAEDENRLIGVNDRLPWRLPKELKHFKETTMGQAC